MVDSREVIVPAQNSPDNAEAVLPSISASDNDSCGNGNSDTDEDEIISSGEDFKGAEHGTDVGKSWKPIRKVPRSLRKSVRRVQKHFGRTVQEHPFANLCSTCYSMFTGPTSMAWGGEWHNHHQSQAALDESVRLNCWICVKIRDELPRTSSNYSTQNHHIASDSEVISLDYSIDLGSMLLDIESFTATTKRGKSMHLHFSIIDPLHMWVVPNSELPLTTSSRAVLELCRYWVHQCRTKHIECGYNRRNPIFRPSRLVRIDGIRNGTIVAWLDCASVASKPVQYLTLSHCWGRTKFYTLRKENLRCLQQQIPVVELSKVFQDALFFTLKLGFRYLWIDSLCIIQDSHEDWLQESAHMGEIYTHSCCTIAATGFSDGEQGLFVDRDATGPASNAIRTRWKSDGLPSIEPAEKHYILVDHYFWDGQVDEAPLLSRGWVLQERLLSPCVLHFGAQQLLWECFESYASETFPAGFPRTMARPSNKDLLGIFDGTPVHNTLCDSRDPGTKLWTKLTPSEKHWRLSLYRLWYKLVEQYSTTEVTSPKDKLLAISGIAKQFQRRLGDEYLAGLWAWNMNAGLLWFNVRDSGVPLQSTYRAPTWSWASLDACVIFYDGSFRSDVCHDPRDAKVISASLTYVTPDKTGLVTAGYIRLEGQLRAATITESTLYKTPIKITGTTIALYMKYDVAGPQNCASLRTMIPARLKASGIPEQVLESDPQAAELAPLPRPKIIVYLLFLTFETSSGRTYGLILSRTGRGRGEYIRIGAFSHMGLSPEDKVTAEACQTLDEDLWEDRSADGRYTITIV